MILFHEMVAYEEAMIEVIVNISDYKVKLDFMRIFIEEFTTTTIITEDQRQHIFKIIYQSSKYMLEPLLNGLERISELTDAESKASINFLGATLNVFSFDLDLMARCIFIVLKLATNLTPKTMKLSILSIESLTEIVSGMRLLLIST